MGIGNDKARTVNGSWFFQRCDLFERAVSKPVFRKSLCLINPTTRALKLVTPAPWLVTIALPPVSTRPTSRRWPSALRWTWTALRFVRLLQRPWPGPVPMPRLFAHSARISAKPAAMNVPYTAWRIAKSAPRPAIFALKSAEKWPQQPQWPEKLLTCKANPS